MNATSMTALRTWASGRGFCVVSGMVRVQNCGEARLLAVLPAFFLKMRGYNLILFHRRRILRQPWADLQGCVDVLLELWPENTLERILLAGAAL